MALIAWSLPPRAWRKAALATSALGEAEHCRPAYRRFLARKYSEAELEDISIRRRAYARELKFQILGLKGPWRRVSRPTCRIEGDEHLGEALARGRGVILWVTECAFSTLIVKMALHDAGYQACQLSRPNHGFSSSCFGIRHLNPLWTDVEDRFIAERILIKGQTAAEAMAVLRERLAANRIVIITVGWQAHKFAEVPFLEDRLQFPTAPIRLARTTGAALLPVFTLANADGSFDVSIGKPLHKCGDDVSDAQVAAAYAKRLEPFVLDHPDQWKGWPWLMGDQGWGPAKREL